MKLYRQTAANDGGIEKPSVHWSGSQTEASAQRKQWAKEGYKRADLGIDEVDVPTDKKGLLEFLNARSV